MAGAARARGLRAPPVELPLTADTLWIDTNRGVCTVTWRGQLRLTDRHERFWGEYSLRHQKKVDRVASTLADSPFLIYQDLAGLAGFTIHRVGVGYDWRRDSRSVGVSLNLENLGNRFYREQFQFSPARGRTVTIGLRVRGL